MRRLCTSRRRRRISCRRNGNKPRQIVRQRGSQMRLWKKEGGRRCHRGKEAGGGGRGEAEVMKMASQKKTVVEVGGSGEGAMSLGPQVRVEDCKVVGCCHAVMELVE